MLIPWAIAELAYSVYAGMYGTGQSLERLAERGGLGANEMDRFLPDWRERCDERNWLLSLLATADRFTLDPATKVVADNWRSGTVFYVYRDNDMGEQMALGRGGKWQLEYLATDSVAFHDATAFPTVEEALAAYQRMRTAECSPSPPI